MILRGLDQNRQPTFRVEVRDSERRLRHALTGLSTGRVFGGSVRRSATSVDLGRRGAAERLVWTVERVVDEAVVDRPVQVLPEQRPLEGEAAERHLEVQPEPLDNRDAAVLSDSSEAVSRSTSSREG